MRGKEGDTWETGKLENIMGRTIGSDGMEIVEFKNYYVFKDYKEIYI